MFPQQMFPVRANGETFRKQQCFRNNVSSFAGALRIVRNTAGKKRHATWDSESST